MVVLAGSLIAIGNMQAQQTQSQRDSLLTLQRNAISLITPFEGKAAGKSGFWGYAFGDYSYMAKGDSAGRGTKQQYKGLGESNAASGSTQNKNPNAFEIRRAYLGYDYSINSHFSAYALLAYEGDQDVSDNRTVYMKYMYVKWKNIFKNSDLKLGQQATNSFASAYNTEPLMGYRASEKTIMDMHGVDGSSDMGLTLEGRIWTAHAMDTSKVPLFIGYSLMIGNNSGNNPVAGFTGNATSLSGSTLSAVSYTYTTTTTTTVPLTSYKTGKDTTINGISTVTATSTSKTSATASGKNALTLNPFNNSTDEAKKIRFNLYVNALNNALTVGVYGDYINYGDIYYGTAKGYQSSVMTQKVYAAYNSKWFGLGGEMFMQTMTNGEVEVTTSGATVTHDTTTAEQMGVSVFAHATILQNCLNIFGRYDMYTPDTKYSFNTTETFASKFTNISSNTYKESFMNVGLDWTPTKDKKIHIMPNLWYYAIKNGFGSDNLASDNYMLYRVTFLFGFN